MRSDDAGFSLIELVVAMAIVSLVLVGVVQAVRGSLSSVAAAARTAEAATVLAGQWAALEREGFVEGSSEGELPGGWRWTCEAAEATDTRLYHVSMQLFWNEGGRQRQIGIDALTPVPPEE